MIRSPSSIEEVLASDDVKELSTQGVAGRRVDVVQELGSALLRRSGRLGNSTRLRSHDAHVCANESMEARKVSTPSNLALDVKNGTYPG